MTFDVYFYFSISSILDKRYQKRTIKIIYRNKILAYIGKEKKILQKETNKTKFILMALNLNL